MTKRFGQTELTAAPSRPAEASAGSELGVDAHVDSEILAKILVVDDDRRNLLAVEEMLRQPGIDIVLAESGEAALRQVLRHDFAAILLDVQMPVIDGYEVAAMIRRRQRSSRVPILFLTAFNKDELHVFRGYEAGAVDYVFKPIEPLILRSKVSIFVDLYRKTEEIRRQAEAERRLLMENLRARGDKLKAEQALRRREEQQSLVLQSLPIALYTATLQEDHRRLHFTSESVERITGHAQADFLSEPDFWERRVHPDDHDRVMAQLASVTELGAVTLEYRWRCADETYCYILEQFVIVRDEEGLPREFFGLWFDNTERKELEQDLLHASKLEAVGRLTGGIAHDFNNMLSVVIGNLDLLQRSVQGNERATRRITLAVEGAQRCADLTQRLLAFSRRQPLQATRVSVQALMPGFLDLMRRTLGERIEISLDAPDDAWPVTVDEAQLEAALLNLAVNARDAMPDGGELAIRLANRVVEEAAPVPGASPGSYLVIEVADTGTGMPASVRERVFEPFFTTKEVGKGTGLGLSMVYGFVQQSEGTIEIESEEGRGTTIRMLLPRADGAEEPERKPAEPAAIEPEFGNGRTVLVVEDDPAVRQVAVSTLQDLGFEVREAANGDDAAEMLGREGEVELLLSDVKMPGEMTGIDLARFVRERWPSVRILLTSGYVEAEEPIQDFDFIHKPYRASELATKIRRSMQAA